MGVLRRSNGREVVCPDGKAFQGGTNAPTIVIGPIDVRPEPPHMWSLE
jgi:hypothetical protein